MTNDLQTHAPDATGLAVDANLLLRAVSHVLLREPALTRDGKAALAMLQRYRAHRDYRNPFDPVTASEITCQQAFETSLGALASADATDSTGTGLPPPDAAAIEECMRSRVYGNSGGNLANLVTIEGGYSKQTSLFDWVRNDGSVDAYVMRRDARLKHIGTTVRDEFPLVTALHRAGMPVAEAVLVETGNARIPEPFMVMRRLPGRAIGGPLGAGADRRVDPSPTLARVLARVHSLPPATLGVPGFSDRVFDRNALLASVRYWSERYLAHRAAPSQVMENTLDFLAQHADAGVQPGAVVHGDCDFYNMLFDGERFVALLDWEMAHLGSPAWDLSYVREAVSNFGSYDAFLDEYARNGGVRPSAAALAYYNVFRLVRGAVMCVVGAATFNRGEPISVDLLNVNCSLYPRFLQQMPDAVRAFHACA